MDRVTELKQEIFDEIWSKAGKQGFEPSYADENNCAYRGGSDEAPMCCNVGFLIPDARYRSDIEGKDLISAPCIFELTTAYDRCLDRGFDTIDQEEILCFLRQVQDAHDTAGDAEDHQRALAARAKEEGLNIPEIA